MKKLMILTAFFAFGAAIATAQPQNPRNPVPLDGGISLLVAAGAAFGAKKLYNKKKSADQENNAA